MRKTPRNKHQIQRRTALAAHTEMTRPAFSPYLGFCTTAGWALVDLCHVLALANSSISCCRHHSYWNSHIYDCSKHYSNTNLCHCSHRRTYLHCSHSLDSLLCCAYKTSSSGLCLPCYLRRHSSSAQCTRFYSCARPTAQSFPAAGSIFQSYANPVSHQTRPQAGLPG